MSSQSWIASDLPPIVRDGTEYFILSHHDVLYLIANSCPHRGGPLKFGFINAHDEIVCPLHQGAFPIAKLVAQASTIRLGEREVARR
jgi:nitrite reductase (NADH) small subunit